MDSQIHFSKRGDDSILSKPLTSNNFTINDSTFGYLFSALVSYQRRRTSGVQGLEQKLNQCGFNVGYKVVELISLRNKTSTRLNRISDALQFVSTVCWQYLFGKNADSLDTSSENKNDFFITDKNPLFNKYISVPKDLGELNCCAYCAGIIHGILVSSGFNCEVTAYNNGDNPKSLGTIYLVSFAPEVMEREEEI
ncbi:hypothetical protein WA158_007003 [Blastocystis sp. Blastoise]